MELIMPTVPPLTQPLVWMDLEMTGLDPDRDRIIEIAVIVSGGSLEPLVEGPDLAIHQAAEVLDGMDEWNTQHHGASGLVERVRASDLDEAAAEARVIEFLRDHVAEGVAPLAGNSVHQDRAFLRRWMPRLHGWLHYRNVDVSTVKELARRWAPTVLEEAPVKAGNHRALDDIRESIRELAYYRTSLGPSWRPESEDSAPG
jgi:oligoribonuclease